MRFALSIHLLPLISWTLSVHATPLRHETLAKRMQEASEAGLSQASSSGTQDERTEFDAYKKLSLAIHSIHDEYKTYKQQWSKKALRNLGMLAWNVFDIADAYDKVYGKNEGVVALAKEWVQALLHVVETREEKRVAAEASIASPQDKNLKDTMTKANQLSKDVSKIYQTVCTKLKVQMKEKRVEYDAKRVAREMAKKKVERGGDRGGNRQPFGLA